MIRIKICGITRPDDAAAACEAGADALGFVFYPPSPRSIAPADAAAIIRGLPPFVTTVGLFVDQDEAAVRKAADSSGVDVLQFHGHESAEYCRGFQRRVIKAFRCCGDRRPDMESYQVSAVLLDTYHPHLKGGTGTSFDWTLAAAAIKNHPDRRVILAGGLNADNIVRAMQQVRPYGVDVSSGVETAPGRKDPAEIRKFIRRVRGHERIVTP